MKNRLNIIKFLLSIPLLMIILLEFMVTGNTAFIILFIVSVITITGYVFILKTEVRNASASRPLNEEEHKVSNIQNEDISLEIIEMKEKINLMEDELEALRATSEIFLSAFDINSIIQYIFKVCKKFTGCDRVLLNFIEKDTGNLICKHEVGDISVGETGKVFPEDSVIRKCYEERKPIVLENVFIKTRNIYGDKVALPLYSHGEHGGVIYIETGMPGTFSGVNMAFLASLANYAAIAIKNADLFTNVYLQKQEIEALYEETAAVNEELNNYIDDLNKAKEELKFKNEELTNYYNEIQASYLQTVMTLANAIEAKDSYTRGHCQRVMELSCEIATKMGLSDEEISDLRYAAILHDIGKIGIPAAIINKPDKLTDEEFNEIKKHPQISYNILKDIEFIQKGLDGILQHHERYDGRGYPNGLKGNEISLFGRILCVADAFDAMTSDRPYRKGMPMDVALKEIDRCKGAQFDPEIADLFISMTNEIIPSSEAV